eukprot:gnl/Dysnectes_brevis/3595_a4573_1050.p1 GENE.gnl/Dysnectes_brevis/3595_a4573_1050~~gnl/Dysnectes_brevis/3595_a4573_1050.p1  ORF type:complete len:386 (-),score=90.22 gnl/Dysnectes_brevis/3595_a4573_1050:102-1259(-)
MKLLKEKVNEECYGTITLCIERNTDLYTLWKIIREGNHVTSTTFRKVVKERADGSKSVQRKKLKVRLYTTSTTYLVEEEKLKVQGKNTTPCDFIPLGSAHTLNISTMTTLTIEKVWSPLERRLVSKACDLSERCDVVLAVLTRDGVGRIALLDDESTHEKARVEQSIPKKSRTNQEKILKAKGLFFDKVVTVLKQHVRADRVRVLLIGGAAEVAEKFASHIKGLQIDPFRSLEAIIWGRTASPLPSGAIRELLRDPRVASRLGESRWAQEARELEEFRRVFSTAPDLALYAPGYIRQAMVQPHAIKTLLVSESLLLSDDLDVRAETELWIETASTAGAAVHVMGTEHAAGKQLVQFGGVASVLNYGVYIDEEAIEAAISDGESSF